MAAGRSISSLGVALLLREPFFGHLLSGLVKAPASIEGVALGWLGELPVLRVGPADSLGSEAHRIGAVKHELLHLLFRHPVVKKGRSLPWLYHVAADLVVNQYLPVEERECDALTLEAFAPLELTPGRDAGDYYDCLLDAWRAVPAAPLPAWRRLLGRCLRGEHPAVRRHAGWHGGGRFAGLPRSGAAARRLEHLLETARRATPAAALDRLAPALRARLAPAAPAPAIDWRRQVRLFAASRRRSRLRHTIRRPSKRYGTTPGLRRERRSRLLVAVDTSASVSPVLLESFFSEIHRLWSHGHELLVVECDTIIRRRYRYRGQLPQMALGRGGTRFDAPVDWARKNFRADGILYFTDGKGPPLREPPPCPLLWVVGKANGALHTTRRQPSIK